MSAEQLLRDGKPEDALRALQDQIRQKPADPALRVFLFQLLCLLGQWDRALNQLNVAGEIDASTLAMVNTYRPALSCEAFREKVFAGEHTPLVFGDPQPWLAPLIQALAEDAAGHSEAAERLRDQAFELAPAVAGRLNDQDFEWLADADPRLGPVLEAIINGRYYWLPMMHIRSLSLEAPSDLRDLVWTPAHITLANGGEIVALLPSRYPGSAKAEDAGLRLARKTDWTAEGLPLGQRMFATDAGETALFDVRQIDFSSE